MLKRITIQALLMCFFGSFLSKFLAFKNTPAPIRYGSILEMAREALRPAVYPETSGRTTLAGFIATGELKRRWKQRNLNPSEMM